MKIIDEMYQRERAEVINALWEDRANQNSILSALYKELWRTRRVLSNPNEQLLIIFSQADFAKSDEERVYVAGIFSRRLFDLDIIPRLALHRGGQFAEKALVSLGLFEDYMERKFQTQGFPSPDFYRYEGRRAFEEIGRFDIARNFDDWTQFSSAQLLTENSNL